MKLVIANKLYSSWSLRPWILMRHLGLAFEEIVIPLDEPDTRERILHYSPAGKVPVLVLDDGFTIWDSLAIIEFLAEKYPDLGIWPGDIRARAHARAICAEMHSGFQALRRAMPMNLGKRYASRDRGEAVARDCERVIALWTQALTTYGNSGPFLFGDRFSAADAMYAPVVTRLDTYGYPVDGIARDYMNTILALPAFSAWRDAALCEPWTVADDEVDEEPIAVLRVGAA